MMELFLAGLFRFLSYVFVGLSMEVVFAVVGIERTLKSKVPRRVPKKYLEGFVSLYMIPLHGLGILFLFEPFHEVIREYHFIFRYVIWCLTFFFAEILWGVLLYKVLKFYPWDYYKESPVRVHKLGFSSWSLLPWWGVAGLIAEFYTDLLIKLTPEAVQFAVNYFSF